MYQLLGASDFILRPQPDLVFFRDQSVWIGDQVAVASPAAACRRLPAELTGIVYAHHPLFAGTKSLYRPGLEPLHGGDLLLAAPGVIAAGCPPPGVATHTRLERVGIDVITVPGSELCGSRGGPRSLCCPVSRDPAPLAGDLSTEL